MNRSPEFFDSQRSSENQLVEMYVEKDDITRKVYFDTKPTKSKNDPACGAPKKPAITGYQCRVNQLRADPDFNKLPDGINSKVIIKVPANNAELLGQVTGALGCVETQMIPHESHRPVPAPVPASGAPTKH